MCSFCQIWVIKIERRLAVYFILKTGGVQVDKHKEQTALRVACGGAQRQRRAPRPHGPRQRASIGLANLQFNYQPA